MAKPNPQKQTFQTRRTERQIDHQVDIAYGVIDAGKEVKRGGYVEGVRDALEWILGDNDAPPMRSTDSEE
jgi:hypothetical protein